MGQNGAQFCFCAWSLELLWSLEFGLWSLLPGFSKIEMFPSLAVGEILLATESQLLYLAGP
jgi:hypothetical protein